VRAYLLCLACGLLTAWSSVPCLAGNSVDAYAESVMQLVHKQQERVDRLASPADLTAKALLAGAAFYIGGDPAFVSEGTGRAGGLLTISPLPTALQFEQLGEMFGKIPQGAVINKGDVVWLAYTAETIVPVQATANDLEKKGCLVIAFGPRPADGAPHFSHWLDSFTPWSGKANLARIGNLLSLWTLTGEVTADTARVGHTLGFFQSLVIYGARERNDIYTSQQSSKGTVAMSSPPQSTYHSGLNNVFHDGIPTMKPVEAGVLARAYLDYVSNMLGQIKEKEIDTITKVGQEMARRASESNQASLMALGHVMFYASAKDGKLFRYLDWNTEYKNLQTLLGSDGYFIWLGYVATPLDLWHAVRSAKAKAVWVVAPLPDEVDFRQFGDVVINEHWLVGDGAVDVPGYDVKILPPSGVAQLFIYELMLRAAGS
jgi:uncharacterized phosphosugar-binding protein